MTADWSRAVDVARLADAGEVREFDVDLAEFPRLAEQLAGVGGRARGSLQVSRERGVPLVDIEISAEVPLVCQRCLGRMELAVQSAARVAVVADLAAADALDAGIEPFLATEGRIVLRELAEEQLLLALPLVARHADADQCEASSAAATDAPAAFAGDVAAVADKTDDISEQSGVLVTQKPFAELGELLKRRR